MGKVIKGRSTSVISVRLDNDIVYTLRERAERQGFSGVGDYLRAQILKSCSVNAMTEKPVNTIKEVKGDSVDTTDVGIPWYDPSRHSEMVGQKARVKDKGKVKIVVVPELDAEGRPMPW